MIPHGSLLLMDVDLPRSPVATVPLRLLKTVAAARPTGLSSTCSSRITDGSYFLLSQLNQPSRTELKAPTALKLAADSFCSSANFNKPFASSSPLWNTKMNVFGDSSICLKFMSPPQSTEKA
jgi:hypothetical protein